MRNIYIPEREFQRTLDGFAIPMTQGELKAYLQKVPEINRIRQVLIENEKKDHNEALSRGILPIVRKIPIQDLSSEEVQRAFKMIEAQERINEKPFDLEKWKQVQAQFKKQKKK